MSAALTDYSRSGIVDTLKYTPIWNLDGGLDSNPAPYTAQQVANAYLSQGANYVYTDFTTLGHGTWDSTWEEPNFWPFVNDAYLSNPWPLFDNTIFCPGTAINVTMGIVPGLDGYQWRRNDTIIPGAVSNSIVATQPGTYDARVLRGSTWSDWSHSPVIISSGLPPLTHTVTQPTCKVAKGSIVITAPRGDTIYYSLNGQPFSTTANWDSLSAGIYHITIKDTKCNNATFTDTINTQPVTPNKPVTTVMQPTCAVSSGTITIAPQDTTFEWTIYNGKYYSSKVKYSNLGPQMYIVTAESPGGCVSVKDTVVVDSALVVPAIPGVNVTQPTCTVPTGMIAVKTAGADTGLTYAINGGKYQTSSVFKNLQGGKYLVTASNKTCPSPADTVTIDPTKVIPSPPALSLVQPTCTVATGAITVTSPISSSDSGQNALAYSINGSNYQPATEFEGVAPGSYDVTVKNSDGCVSSSTAAIIHVQPKPPGRPKVSVTQPTCTTGSGTITISAADTMSLSYSINGSTYLAQSSFPNLTMGTYQVTAQNDAGCVSAAAQAVVDSLPARQLRQLWSLFNRRAPLRLAPSRSPHR